jgi:hypothetical protein
MWLKVTRYIFFILGEGGRGGIKFVHYGELRFMEEN